jgi:hypothetical protein
MLDPAPISLVYLIFLCAVNFVFFYIFRLAPLLYLIKSIRRFSLIVVATGDFFITIDSRFEAPATLLAVGRIQHF